MVGKCTEKDMIKFPYPWMDTELYVKKGYLEEIYNDVQRLVREEFKRAHGHKLNVRGASMAVADVAYIYREKEGMAIGVAILKKIMAENNLQLNVKWPSLSVPTVQPFESLVLED